MCCNQLLQTWHIEITGEQKILAFFLHGYGLFCQRSRLHCINSSEIYVKYSNNMEGSSGECTYPDAGGIGQLAEINLSW